MKILNLYAGIGGNRKLWQNVEVTAVENNGSIATIYQDFYPKDTVVVGDAHQYLLDHYAEFDFIWASPPCPTHSSIRYAGSISGKDYQPAVYPDMKLYQEILFLKHYAKLNTKWVVENVVPFYDYLIRPSFKLQRHPFWANFLVADKSFNYTSNINKKHADVLQKELGINIDAYNLNSYDKRKALRNCVYPPIGVYILEQAKQKPTIQTQSMQLALV